MPLSSPGCRAGSNPPRSICDDSGLDRLFQHHAGTDRGDDDLVLLVVADMLEDHDAGVRMLLALALRDDVRLAADRVADPDRVGETDFFVAEIAHRRAE